jgi:hypothetical protein
VNSLRGDSQELGQLQADKVRALPRHARPARWAQADARRGQVRWMQKEMWQVVERVNEALDEIRYWDLD